MMDSSFFLLLLAFLSCAAQARDICNSSLCRCSPSGMLSEITDVDCSKVSVHVVPPVTSWPPKTKSLDLSFNNISGVQFEMTLTTLSTLKLNNNKIKVVNSSAFAGLSNLRILDLSNNLLADLQGNEFRGLGKLQVLNMSNNKIKIVPDLIFYHLFELEELSLAKNPIIHMDSVLFNRMLNLKRLDISDTGAYSLPPNLFSVLEQFEALDLSANDFHEVPTDALRSARNLKWLRLSENPIEEFDKTSFRRLDSLEVLEINYMDYLVSIGSRTFSDLTSLRVLEAKWNPKLSHVDKYAFAGLFNATGDSVPALQEISFEMAKLTTLDAKTFNCKTLQKLNLQRNPWYCDCRIKWIKGCPISSVYAEDFRCDSPPALRNDLIVDVDDEKLLCDQMLGPSVEEIHHDRVVRLMSLVLGCAVLITLALGIILVLKWKSIKNWWRVKRRGPGPVYYVRTKTYPTET